MAEQSSRNTNAAKANIIECMKCFNKVSTSSSQAGGAQQNKRSGVQQDNAANWMYSKKCPHRLQKSQLLTQSIGVIIVLLISKLVKVERQVQIASFVKPSIPPTMTSFRTILNGSGRENEKCANKLCPCKVSAVVPITSSFSYNMRPQDFSSDEAYNAYLEAREDMIQDLVEGRNLEDIKRKLDQHKRLHQRQTDQANQKQREIQENLVVIIKCENARLNFNFYEKKQLQENLNIEEKEKASKLLENLKLDKMDEQLTNNAVQQTFDEEDADMIVETQRSAASAIQRLGTGHSNLLEKLQLDVESQKPSNIVAIQNQKERERVLMEVGGVKNQGKTAAQQRQAKMFSQGLKKN